MANKVRVLLIGTGLFYHIGAFFKKALEDLRLPYVFIDDWKYQGLLEKSWLHRVYFHLKKRPFTYTRYNQDIVKTVGQFRPDLVLITKGAYISRHTLEYINQTRGALLINYATDDPFNPANRTPDLIQGIPFYDLYVCTKRAIIEDIRVAGAKSVTYLPFAYEPGLHFPERPSNQEEIRRFESDVVFIGTADLNRMPVVHELCDLTDLNIHLYGGYWHRDQHTRPHYRGFAYGRDYRLALGGAKIALCLLRHANRDGQTMRTFEIPACRVFMLAERSDEHLEIFIENREIVCFSSIEEMIEKIAYYTSHEVERLQIADAGFKRILADKHTYKNRLIQILTLSSEL